MATIRLKGFAHRRHVRAWVHLNWFWLWRHLVFLSSFYCVWKVTLAVCLSSQRFFLLASPSFAFSWLLERSECCWSFAYIFPMFEQRTLSSVFLHSHCPEPLFQGYFGRHVVHFEHLKKWSNDCGSIFVRFAAWFHFVSTSTLENDSSASCMSGEGLLGNSSVVPESRLWHLHTPRWQGRRSRGCVGDSRVVFSWPRLTWECCSA